MVRIRSRWSSGLRPGLPVITTWSPGLSVSRVTPWRFSCSPAPHSTAYRTVFPCASFPSTCTNECGLRNRNCTRSPSMLSVLSSKYVAANEWCAYAGTAVYATATENATAPVSISSLRVMCIPPNVVSALLLFCRRLRRRCRLGRFVCLREILVHGFDEHIRRPRTGRRAPAGVVVERELRRLHLIERLSTLDRVLHAIANDRHHVAVLEQ